MDGCLSGGESLFAAACGLTEMAGWMAHDSGQDVWAKQHFQRALGFAFGSGERQLLMQIYGSLSHLALSTHQPGRALEYAQHDQQRVTRGGAYPRLMSRLVALEALSYARLGEQVKSRERLVRAEYLLDVAQVEEPSPWVSSFDEASFAGEASRCLYRLGEAGEAKHQAERILKLRPQGRSGVGRWHS
jgi:hypothetical protein